MISSCINSIMNNYLNIENSCKSKQNSTSNIKRTSFQRGILGEEKAKKFLIRNGYNILFQRYKSPLGEIDIIAKKNNVIHIIEVKNRPTIQKAREAISQKQIDRISQAADFFVGNLPYDEQNIVCVQFDVIFITNNLITLLENAWYLN